MALQSPLHVPVGLSMPHEEEGGALGWVHTGGSLPLPLWGGNVRSGKPAGRQQGYFHCAIGCRRGLVVFGGNGATGRSWALGLSDLGFLGGASFGSNRHMYCSIYLNNSA